jgi:hypothetical protein
MTLLARLRLLLSILLMAAVSVGTTATAGASGRALGIEIEPVTPLSQLAGGGLIEVLVTVPEAVSNGQLKALASNLPVILHGWIFASHLHAGTNRFLVRLPAYTSSYPVLYQFEAQKALPNVPDQFSQPSAVPYTCAPDSPAATVAHEISVSTHLVACTGGWVTINFTTPRLAQGSPDHYYLEIFPAVAIASGAISTIPEGPPLVPGHQTQRDHIGINDPLVNGLRDSTAIEIRLMLNSVPAGCKQACEITKKVVGAALINQPLYIPTVISTTTTSTTTVPGTTTTTLAS